MALKGVADRPITGYGQEGFNYVFNTYYQPSLYAQEPWFDRAHDVFIDWLVAGGIPGFLLFIALFVTTAITLYKREASKAERVLVLAALTAYAIQAIVVFDNIFTYVPLAAILATAHATSTKRWKKIDAIEQASESTLQVAVPLVAVLAIAIIWTVNIPNISAAGELVRGLSLQSTDITPNVTLFQQALAENTYATQEIREQLVIFMSQVASSGQGATPALSQLAQYAITEMDKEVALQPLDARLRLESALGYRVTGNYKQALEQVQAAHELSPKKQSILLEQGIEYWQVGDFEKARASFHSAYELDTSFPAVAAYAAAGDIAAGHMAEGKALLMQSQGTTTVDSEPLVLAYFQAKQYPELISVLQLQVTNQNNDPKARFRLAAAYAAAGRKAEADQEIQGIVKDHPELSTQAAQFEKSLSSGK
jgi:Flp pilus assembly protein TadD